MQAALDHAGYELTARLTGAPGWWDCATCVGNGSRHVSIVLGSQERWFLMEFWERGVMMANGKTTELAPIFTSSSSTPPACCPRGS